MQDFAAVDALTADHYAVKPLQPAASAVALPQTAIASHPHQWQPQQDLNDVSPHLHANKYSQIRAQSQHASHSNMQSTARQQASMQQYLVPQPADYVQHASLPANPVYEHGQQLSRTINMQYACAAGVLADKCVDLDHQAETMAGVTASAADCDKHSTQQPLHLAPDLVAVESKAIDCAAHAKHSAADMDISNVSEENGPLEELMECSTNLLNAGIRVHKYSNAHFAQVSL